MRVSPSEVSRSAATPNPFPFRPADVVLLIDDDAFNADLLIRILAGAGRRVLRARSAREAAHLFAAHQDQIALVMVDGDSPAAEGVSLCRRLRRAAPELPVILTSGFEIDGLPELVADGPTVFLAKPFFAVDVEELAADLIGVTV